MGNAASSIVPTGHSATGFLQHHLADNRHKNYNFRHDHVTFFESKPAEFYKRGIDQLRALGEGY